MRCRERIGDPEGRFLRIDKRLTVRHATLPQLKYRHLTVCGRQTARFASTKGKMSHTWHFLLYVTKKSEITTDVIESEFERRTP